MQNQYIKSVKTDQDDPRSAANVEYVKTKEADLIKQVQKAPITSSSKRDAFWYLVEDVNESSSESNTIVNGINGFTGFPDQVNKKAYDITFTTDEDNEFRSRVGFNIYNHVSCC